MSADTGLTIRGLLESRAAQTPNAAALLAPGRDTMTYAQLLSQVNRSRTARQQAGAGLVRQLASAQWRLVRYTPIEAILLDLEMEMHREHFTQEWNRIEECGRLALAFEALSGAILRLPPPKRNYKTNPRRSQKTHNRRRETQ